MHACMPGRVSYKIFVVSEEIIQNALHLKECRDDAIRGYFWGSRRFVAEMMLHVEEECRDMVSGNLMPSEVTSGAPEGL